MSIFKESPLTITFQILNKKWTIEIILELFKGRKRFSDLLEIDPSLTSKVLSERLKALYKEGIIEKIVINMMPLKLKYEITEKGKLLNRIFFEIALYSCMFYPDRVFDTPPSHEKEKELVEQLRTMFQIENINFENIKANYFD